MTSVPASCSCPCSRPRHVAPLAPRSLRPGSRLATITAARRAVDVESRKHSIWFGQSTVPLCHLRHLAVGLSCSCTLSGMHLQGPCVLFPSVYRPCVVYAVSVVDLPQIAAPCTKAAAEGDPAHSFCFPYFHLRSWRYSSYCSRSSHSPPASPPPMLCFHTLNPCLHPLLAFPLIVLPLLSHTQGAPCPVHHSSGRSSSPRLSFRSSNRSSSSSPSAVWPRHMLHRSLPQQEQEQAPV